MTKLGLSALNSDTIKWNRNHKYTILLYRTLKPPHKSNNYSVSDIKVCETFRKPENSYFGPKSIDFLMK